VSDDRTQDLERISAYVDGELDAAARAEVIRTAANDPAFARELIAHERLKGALADLVEVPDIRLPAPPRRNRVARAAFAVAASLVLLVAAAAGWTVFREHGKAGEEIALDRAIETHRAWSVNVGRKNSAVALWRASGVPDAYVPDLSSNGLNIGHVSGTAAAGDGKALVIGYMGSRGCRVTLIMQSSGESRGADPIYAEIGAVRVYSWRAGTLAYRMLAEGMATARFRLIAASVRRASFDHLPLDADTRVALARSRARSAPCAA